MRFATDTGGTFTDLVIEDDDGTLSMFKTATTPSDPVSGVLDALGNAAKVRGVSLGNLLASADTFIHGTTHAINAIITGNTARTAFLTTAGHPDILVLRDGGRSEPFNHTVPYPDPYVPRRLTFEVPERIGPAGDIIAPFDEKAAIELMAKLKEAKVQAVAVCLLWSIVNPAHEEAIGRLLDEYLPGVPYTLSHRLNPALREYRRASSTAIDASLKPLMSSYLGGLTSRLSAAGFGGRVLVLTSQGGMIDADDLAAAPIHAINSGPSMAPLAGRYFARTEGGSDTAIIADTGGTTYDVSLVRGGRIPMTREMWIGEPYRGHITGFPSVDVTSVGAGGGSIAWVDDGGMLHVGPQSAGAVPGPACYGAGGTAPTVTDACLVLGYLDPAFFLGGSMVLDTDGAREAIAEHVARPLGIDEAAAAAAILELATENMVQAIQQITVNQGIDPASAVLIGGGGAGGLNATFVARRLGCPKVIIPELGAALSAAGALMSDLVAEFRSTTFATTESFDVEAANTVLAALDGKCRAFLDGPGKGARSHKIEFAVEARYANQVWEIEVPLPEPRFKDDKAVRRFADAFHAAHEEIFAITDPASPIEIVAWAATVRCKVADEMNGRLPAQEGGHALSTSRQVYFPGHGKVEADIVHFEALAPGEEHAGPAIVESPFTTVVIDADARYKRTEGGSLVIYP